MIKSNTKATKLDLTKWTDIKNQFVCGTTEGVFAGAAAAFGAVSTLAIATVIGGGPIANASAAIAGAAAGGSVGSGALASGAVGLVGDTNANTVHERPIAKHLGHAFGFAIPVTVAIAIGSSSYKDTDTPKNNATSFKTLSAPALASCNESALKAEIKRLSDAGFIISCPK